MSNGYIKSLDGVRAIAIILVMTFHADITHFGWVGVQLFFVLSGFLITSILWKEKFKEDSLAFKFKKFWVRRSLRIFPLYFGYLFLLGITYLLFHFPWYYKTYFPYLVTYTFNYSRTLTQWHGNPLFTHLWSLSVEEQFYLFFPWIIFLCSSKVIKTLMIVFICISPVIRFLLGEYLKNKGYAPAVAADIIYWNTGSHLDAFFMGGIIPVLGLDKKIDKPQYLLYTGIVITLLAGFWNFLNSDARPYFFIDLGFNIGQINNYEHVWHYTILNFLFASFILTLISIKSEHTFPKLRRLLESRWMVRIGKVSYGMYIYHWIILVYVYQHLLHFTTPLLHLLSFIPYLISVYLIAELSYTLYESYFIKLKDKLFVRKAAAQDNFTSAVIPVKKETVTLIKESPE
ncbi:MAG: acyltransferase family protein [Ilyomonas sp.]